MSLANLVRRMTEAGAPPEAIAIALEEIETIQASLDARRTADRDRKRDQRERQKTSNVTGQSEDSPETVTPESDGRVFLDKKAPQTPEKIKPIPCVRETRVRLGYHRMPEGWQPSKTIPPQLQAKIDQWPPGAFGDEVAALKRWAANAEDKNGKGRKLDWDKAFWNWIGRRHDERYSRDQANRGSNGRLGGPRTDPTLELVRSARAAQREDRGDNGQTRPALPAGQFG